MPHWTLADLDLFFISYDEPEADAHYQHLQSIAPREVRRVHGVKGFHEAHLEASRRSTTSRFVTVDGDSHVHARMFEQSFDDTGMEDAVISFAAENPVNGLCYGNGGVKCWPRGLLEATPTHTGTGKEATDFYHVVRYWTIDSVLSETRFNSSPLHAFRGGYREGVKMSLTQGVKAPSWEEARASIPRSNWSRLSVWCSVGADAPHGLWAILGARMALHDLWIRNFPTVFIRHYDMFGTVWEERYAQYDDPTALIESTGRMLRRCLGEHFPLLSPQDSQWFKSVYSNPTRQGFIDPSMPPVRLA